MKRISKNKLQDIQGGAWYHFVDGVCIGIRGMGLLGVVIPGGAQISGACWGWAAIRAITATA